MDRANKPLTLEQLRGIDGQPVWIKDLKTPECSGWRMIYWNRGKYLVLIAKSIQGYILEEYGKTWFAYAQQPAHIDREKWGPCEDCEENLCENCKFIHLATWEQPCSECKGKSNWQPAGNYCWCCGRPLTEEAWAELERRVGLCR